MFRVFMELAAGKEKRKSPQSKRGLINQFIVVSTTLFFFFSFHRLLSLLLALRCIKSGR